jgi:hypothetical protein
MVVRCFAKAHILSNTICIIWQGAQDNNTKYQYHMSSAGNCSFLLLENNDDYATFCRNGPMNHIHYGPMALDILFLEI